MGCFGSKGERKQAEEGQINEEEFNQRLDDIFEKYNKDKSGALSREEVAELLNDTTREMGGQGQRTVTTREVQDFINACDINHNGKIERNELYTMYKQRFAKHLRP